MTAICGILNIHIFVVDRKQKNKFTNSMCLFCRVCLFTFYQKIVGVFVLARLRDCLHCSAVRSYKYEKPVHFFLKQMAIF